MLLLWSLAQPGRELSILAQLSLGDVSWGRQTLQCAVVSGTTWQRQAQGDGLWWFPEASPQRTGAAEKKPAHPVH